MRRRLFLITLATTSLVVIAFALPLAGLVDRVAADRAITAAERDIASLAPVLAVTTDVSAIEGAVANTATGADSRLTVWLPDGTAVGPTGDEQSASLDLAQQRRLAFSEYRSDGLDLYTPVLLSEDRVAVIKANVPNRLLDNGVASAWAVLALIGIGLVIAATVIADRLARSVNQGAGELAQTARLLAGGDLAARASTSNVPELADASTALNLLADRIDELRSAERERVADLSHRLRTPLTALRLGVEASGNSALDDDVNRLEAAVTDLIRSARRPLHDSLTTKSCDLVAVARDRAEFWGALGDEDARSWEFTSDTTDGLLVSVNHSELEAAIDVLIGNVFAHTPEGTPYSVTIRHKGDNAVVVVHDDGPGIGDVETALERGATESGSSGLGLDIARQAAEAGGGHLVFAESDVGTTVELVLPIVKT